MWDLLLGLALPYQPWKASPAKLDPLKLLPWEQAAVFQAPPITSDPDTQAIVDNYLQALARRGFPSQHQGIWIQSGWDIAASHQGKTPLSGASLTKVATTLAALHHWGEAHRFTTDLYRVGEIVNGTLQGDLVIQGHGDPLFVWEEAIALGNTLNRLGIREISGDLLISGDFSMNFQTNLQQAGSLFRQAINFKQWQGKVTKQYLTMPRGTSQPTVRLQGQVKVISQQPATAQLLIRHRSLRLLDILRQMNIYSNNKMAQVLFEQLGGAPTVSSTVARVANFPTAEIELINGSGLGEANKISPRGVCQMLIALERLLNKDGKNLAELFPTAGRDLVGTLQNRGLPTGSAVKTGTLDRVSALAGVIPTRDRGNIYFSLINSGRSLNYFRQQQDQLLNALSQNWQVQSTSANNPPRWYLGDPRRNQAF